MNTEIILKSIIKDNEYTIDDFIDFLVVKTKNIEILKYADEFKKDYFNNKKILIKKDIYVNDINVQLLKYAIGKLDIMYLCGKNLYGNSLKIFSGPQLELFFSDILKKTIELCGLDLTKIDINSDYIKDIDSIYDNQRLDHHIWYKNKIILCQEDRSWIDKPFYILKHGVVRHFICLPHVNKYLHKDNVFVFQSFCTDVSVKTINTCDKVFDFGDKIKLFKLNDYSRSKYKNWFIGGYSKENIKKYISFLVSHFSKFN